MMLPAGPVAHLIVGQTGFALAALDAFFDTMCGFGHPGQFWQRGPRGGVGQVIIHLHHLLLVSVTVAYDHQQLLVALLTSMGSGDHASFDNVDHQRTWRAWEHSLYTPGMRVEDGENYDDLLIRLSPPWG